MHNCRNSSYRQTCSNTKTLTNHQNISHQFDVWHMANSIRKKLGSAAKKKGYEELIPWIRSICNHLWYCAAECDENPEILVELWKSLLFHIQNIHVLEGTYVQMCGHPELDVESARKKKWLKPGSKPYKALESVVLDKRILKDIRHLSKFCHTGSLEVYHSMMLKYIP